MQTWFAEITKEDVTVRLGGDGSNGIDVRTIKGWWSTPDSKVSMTARESGDGSHDVEGRSVLYASRTVTIECDAHGRNRTKVEHQVESLLSMVHGLVRLRVVDARSDTWVDGYVTVSSDVDKVTMGHQGLSVTVTCPDPRRLSSSEMVAHLYPNGSGATGGLSFGPSASGLAYPIGFGLVATESRNYGTIVNRGTSRAYPVITVNGNFDGVRIDLSDGESVSTIDWHGYVGGVPLVLDSRERRATIGGLDVSQHLTSRGFATVAPGGSLSCSLQSAGTGWAEVSVRDTYI